MTTKNIYMHMYMYNKHNYVMVKQYISSCTCIIVSQALCMLTGLHVICSKDSYACVLQLNLTFGYPEWALVWNTRYCVHAHTYMLVLVHKAHVYSTYTYMYMYFRNYRYISASLTDGQVQLRWSSVVGQGQDDEVGCYDDGHEPEEHVGLHHIPD